MKKLIIIVTALTLVSCSKQEDELPVARSVAPVELVVNQEVSTKIVKLDVEHFHSSSVSSYSSDGDLLDQYIHGQWYEFELDSGEFLQVSSSSIVNLGSPVIDVYVDGDLIHTEIGNTNGLVTYTYTNN